VREPVFPVLLGDYPRSPKRNYSARLIALSGCSHTTSRLISSSLPNVDIPADQFVARANVATTLAGASEAVLVRNNHLPILNIRQFELR